MTKDDAYRLIRACCTSLEEARALLEGEPALLEARTGRGETPLHYLVVENHLEGVRFLHEAGGRLNVRNEFGESALLEALRLGNRAVAGYLLDHGADVHLVGGRTTALHGAAGGGDASLVRRVLSLGVPVDARDELENTPLHEAVLFDSAEVVEVLVSAGADVNARSAFDETALHDAAGHGLECMVRLLLNLGADPGSKNVKGETPEDSSRQAGFEAITALLADWRRRQAD